MSTMLNSNAWLERFTLLSQGDPIAYFIPVFIFLILVELAISAFDQRELYTTKDAFTSLGMGLGSVVVNLVVKLFYFGVFMWIYENFALFEIGTAWWAWILLLFADDFTFYWHHRLSHQVRVLWAAHSNHHSSQYYNLTTALRQSWTEFIYKYILWLWLPLLGFHPVMIFTMISVSLIYQFFIHTETVRKLGFLEWIMNTPSHHRVHHATNLKYLDKNHAGIFIIWDRLFGTFEEEDENDKPVYGLTTNVNSYNLVRVAFFEYDLIRADWQKTRSWRTRLKILFKPPGWQPKEQSNADYTKKKVNI
jgi:sterol desaturase/sphingolipid hydroxylase (fatty acid hydroxylase superfamily)